MRRPPARVSGSQKQSLNGPGPSSPPRVLPENHQEDECQDGEMETGLRREEEDHGSCLEENLESRQAQGKVGSSRRQCWLPKRAEARVPLCRECQGELQTLQRPCEQKPQGLRISHRTLSLQFVALRYKRKEDAQPSGSFQSGGGDRPKGGGSHKSQGWRTFQLSAAGSGEASHRALGGGQPQMSL